MFRLNQELLAVSLNLELLLLSWAQKYFERPTYGLDSTLRMPG